MKGKEKDSVAYPPVDKTLAERNHQLATLVMERLSVLDRNIRRASCWRDPPVKWPLRLFEIPWPLVHTQNKVRVRGPITGSLACARAAVPTCTAQSRLV